MTEEKIEHSLDSFLYGIVLESYKDAKGKIRIRPLAQQGLPQSIHVSCPRTKRSALPLGTRFKADLKVCQKAQGRFYLNTLKASVLLTEEEYGKNFPLAKQQCFEFHF